MSGTSRHRSLALLVAACYFIENLDGTIVTTAAPRLALAFHVAADAVGVIMTVYMASLAVGIPVGAWLTRRFGMRPVLLSSILTFTLGSLACAASNTLAVMIGARVVQGVGAALMVPVGRAAVLRDAPKTEVVRLVAYVVWPGLLAPVIAPVLGGLITQYYSWPWIFLVNVPLGVVIFAVALRLVPRTEADATVASPDWFDMALVSLALLAVMLSAANAAAASPRWPLVGAGLAVAAAAGFSGLRRLARSSRPFLEVAVWKIRAVRDSVSGIGLFTVAVAAVPLMLPLALEVLWGWSILRATAVVAGVFVGNIGVKPATTWLLRRLGHRRVVLAGVSGVALSLAALSLLGPSTPMWLIGLVALVSGIARSIGFTGYVTLGFSGVEERLMGAANAFSATTQQVATAVAVAAGALALRLGSALAPHSGPRASHVAFGLMTLVALSPLPRAWAMPRHAGQDLVAR